MHILCMVEQLEIEPIPKGNEGRERKKTGEEQGKEGKNGVVPKTTTEMADKEKSNSPNNYKKHLSLCFIVSI